VTNSSETLCGSGPVNQLGEDNTTFCGELSTSLSQLKSLEEKTKERLSLLRIYDHCDKTEGLRSIGVFRSI